VVEEKEPMATQSETPKKIIEDLDEIKPISKGEELILNFQEEPKVSDVSINIPSKEIKEKTSDEPEKEIKDHYVSIIKDGVEVIDVKAIEKAEERKHRKSDKFGIPIGRDERQNFDKI